jgi:hypothetical protein
MGAAPAGWGADWGAVGDRLEIVFAAVIRFLWKMVLEKGV